MIFFSVDIVVDFLTSSTVGVVGLSMVVRQGLGTLTYSILLSFSRAIGTKALAPNSKITHVPTCLLFVNIDV